MAKERRRQLPWHNTLYNRSLQVGSEDNKFLETLIDRINKATSSEERDKCRADLDFYLEFHRDACTNNNTSDWGRGRRNSRRLDIYNEYRTLIGLHDVRFRGEGDDE